MGLRDVKQKTRQSLDYTPSDCSAIVPSNGAVSLAAVETAPLSEVVYGELVPQLQTPSSQQYLQELEADLIDSADSAVGGTQIINLVLQDNRYRDILLDELQKRNRYALSYREMYAQQQQLGQLLTVLAAQVAANTDAIAQNRAAIDQTQGAIVSLAEAVAQLQQWAGQQQQDAHLLAQQQRHQQQQLEYLHRQPPPTQPVVIHNRVQVEVDGGDREMGAVVFGAVMMALLLGILIVPRMNR